MPVRLICFLSFLNHGSTSLVRLHPASGLLQIRGIEGITLLQLTRLKAFTEPAYALR